MNATPSLSWIPEKFLNNFVV